MDGLLEIPPARSPLLLPTDRARHRTDSTERSLYDLNGRDVLDDMDFIAAGQWEQDEDTRDTEESEDEDEDDDDDLIDDFSLEDGHIVGVPSSSMRLDAK